MQSVVACNSAKLVDRCMSIEVSELSKVQSVLYEIFFSCLQGCNVGWA